VYLGPDFEKANFGLVSPGPCAVGADSAIGKQVASVKVTAPRATFGGANRITSLDGVDRQKRDPNAPVVPARYCPPSHRMPFNSIYDKVPEAINFQALAQKLNSTFLSRKTHITPH
jgi:hypothetical protein